MIPNITRDELANLYGCSQGYLGYLLREKKVPLPVQISGEILWYRDEVLESMSRIKRLLERRDRKKVNKVLDVPSGTELNRDRRVKV